MSKISILAIESSCDETSAAVIVDGAILSNTVATQKVHEKYGGVVPELASRAHQKHIVPVVHEALTTAGIKKEELKAVAFTQGPGLLGSLMVGATFAKTFALALNIPLIGVQHMQAHILAHFIDEPKPKFPFLCLTVSGGHTQLVVVKDYLDMQVVGETQDDAVGEAFDKAAKLLGLGYPGGPLVDKFAKLGNPLAFDFPEVSTEGLNFSFSGIKTAFLYFLQNHTKENPNFIQENLNDICASFQHTLIKILMSKLKRAAKEFKINHVGIAGGVSANSGLRLALKEAGEKYQWNVYVPDFQYCTDNAGMIAITAYYQYLKGKFANQSTVPDARMRF
ncbi:MAG: tRNA (adenosine(37)-N6)-threonylcarbamoyltransferase complex transferase subunit TsaD [Flammeovirgaceae bacterium]